MPPSSDPGIIADTGPIRPFSGPSDCFFYRLLTPDWRGSARGLESQFGQQLGLDVCVKLGESLLTPLQVVPKRAWKWAGMWKAGQLVKLVTSHSLAFWIENYRIGVLEPIRPFEAQMGGGGGLTGAVTLLVTAHRPKPRPSSGLTG